MQVDDQDSVEFVQEIHEAISKGGIIKRGHAHSMFVGPPGSGKSSFMDRLLGRARKKHSPSTGVCNSIIIVDIDIDNPATFLSVTVIDANTWDEVEYDVSLVRQMTNQPDQVTEAKVSAFTQSLPTTKCSYSTKLPTIVNQSDIAAELSDTSNATKLPEVDSKIKEMIDAAIEKCGGYNEFKKKLKKSYSLYLRDTGGQVEFQEMIALLIFGPSIFFFVFRLDLEFQSKFVVEYRVSESESTNRYTSSITTEEALLQCLASVFAMDTSSGKASVKTHKPFVFIVGTHKDKLGPSASVKIAGLNKHLNKLIVENGFEELVQYANTSEGQVMFTIDNTSESDEEVKSIRSKIHSLISSRKEFIIEYPITYLLFCLELQNLKRSVLSLDECKDMAAKYGIVGDQVSHLLQFLHLRLGVIQYFDEDGLRHIVVKEPQVLFNKVTNLIIRTFSSEALTTKERQDFMKGILTASVLESVIRSGDEISSEEFLKLLVHLRIITPYPSTTPGDREERYFIPCVLNHVPECRNEGLLTNVSPLYVRFRSKHCPKGLFGVLVTHLMSPESDEEPNTSFTLLQDKIFKDQVSFEVHSTGVHDEMSLKVCPSHLEVNFFPEASQDRDTSIEEVCSNIRDIVGRSISKSLTNLHYREEIVKPVMCLRCEHCSELHPVEMGKQHRTIYCKTTKTTTRISAQGRCWFNEGESELFCDSLPLNVHVTIDGDSTLSTTRIPAQGRCWFKEGESELFCDSLPLNVHVTIDGDSTLSTTTRIPAQGRCWFNEGESKLFCDFLPLNIHVTIDGDSTLSSTPSVSSRVASLSQGHYFYLYTVLYIATVVPA